VDVVYCWLKLDVLELLGDKKLEMSRGSQLRGAIRHLAK